MVKDSDNGPDKHESLKDLLKKRQELDRQVESKYTKPLTVMFTDIQGSTSFHVKHGDISGRILLEKHDQILRSILSELEGRIIKSTGDGMLIVFDQPHNGVRAAVEMQRRLCKLNQDKREEARLNVRIAINHGNVLEDEEDIHGLTVSIAARINSVAKAGQIIVSKSVYEKVKANGLFYYRSLPEVSVKGLNDKLQLYEVIPGQQEETGRDVQGPSGVIGERSVFVLEISRDGEKLKVSGYEKSSVERKTVRNYREVKIDDSTISSYNADVINLLNSANRKGHVSKDILQRLKTAGQFLYDTIFSVELKQKLAATKSTDLILKIDDHLVNVPWEMLFDGSSFLCLRFNMGRLVKTRQNISEGSPRKIRLPLKMLILSDPQGNLKSAYREGYAVRDNLERNDNIVKVNIKSSSVSANYVMSEIRNYDIVHYAGHADYNTENPSESGLLLYDSILKASDILNLIGQQQLPSMVFSNACKSGHTDSWKVDEEYGSEIFGFANAFLLAGVRHYIGTFWNIQDEPGLYFALNFYKELMSGAMVGEAIRKARLSLIDKYGEDTIIWASYMLYGDPTVRYADVPVSGRTSERRKSPERENVVSDEEVVVGGGIRSPEEVVVFPRKKKKWMLIGSGLFCIFILIALFMVPGNREDTVPVQKSINDSRETAEAKEKRIDEIVAYLLNQYNEDLKAGRSRATDTAVDKTGPPTIVFLNIKSLGVTEIEKEYVFSRLRDILHDSGRVRVVEREILNKLLEELKLSSSRLADPSTALKVGKILSAELIISGSIMKEGRDWQVSLRMIEAETTSLKVALTEVIQTEDKQIVAETLGREVLGKIKREYHLQGRILSYNKDSVVLSIGKNNGVIPGLKMKILPETGKTGGKIGELQIISVEENTSIARVISQRDGFKEGLKVEEIL